MTNNPKQILNAELKTVVLSVNCATVFIEVPRATPTPKNSNTEYSDFFESKTQRNPPVSTSRRSVAHNFTESSMDTSCVVRNKNIKK